MDKAWKDAVAALPEGGYLSMGGPFQGPNYHVAAYSGRTHRVKPGDDHPSITVNGGEIEMAEWIGSGDGPTPIKALRALTARLRTSSP